MVETLDTQLDEPTNQNLIKVPKVVNPTNEKTLFSDQCKEQSNVPSLPTTNDYGPVRQGGIFSFSYSLAKYFREFLKILIGWLIKLSVQTFHPLIVITEGIIL